MVKWEERNQIDGDRAICLSDELLGIAVRWHLRGMDIDLAVRKARTDECYQQELRETEAVIDRLKLNPRSIDQPILKVSFD